MQKIVYLHGLGSSGATQTADYLRNKLSEVEVISPDIPLRPEEALQVLNRLCYEVKPNIIVGNARCHRWNFDGGNVRTTASRLYEDPG